MVKFADSGGSKKKQGEGRHSNAMINCWNEATFAGFGNLNSPGLACY